MPTYQEKRKQLFGGSTSPAPSTETTPVSRPSTYQERRQALFGASSAAEPSKPVGMGDVRSADDTFAPVTTTTESMGDYLKVKRSIPTPKPVAAAPAASRTQNRILADVEQEPVKETPYFADTKLETYKPSFGEKVKSTLYAFAGGVEKALLIPEIAAWAERRDAQRGLRGANPNASAADFNKTTERLSENASPLTRQIAEGTGQMVPMLLGGGPVAGVIEGGIAKGIGKYAGTKAGQLLVNVLGQGAMMSAFKGGEMAGKAALDPNYRPSAGEVAKELGREALVGGGFGAAGSVIGEPIAKGLAKVVPVEEAGVKGALARGASNLARGTAVGTAVTVPQTGIGIAAQAAQGKPIDWKQEGKNAATGIAQIAALDVLMGGKRGGLTRSEEAKATEPVLEPDVVKVVRDFIAKEPERFAKEALSTFTPQEQAELLSQLPTEDAAKVMPYLPQEQWKPLVDALMGRAEAEATKAPEAPATEQGTDVPIAAEKPAEAPQNAPQPLNRAELLRTLNPGMDEKAIQDMVKTTANLSDEEFRQQAPNWGKPTATPATDDVTTINSKTWYHGTGAEGIKAEELDPTRIEPDSLMGVGIYLTDNPEIAQGYAKARGKKTGKEVVYEANVKVDKVLDVEKSTSPVIVQAIKDAIPSRDAEDYEFVKVIDTAAGKEGATTESVLKALQEQVSYISQNEGIPKYEFAEMFGMIGENLRKLGYDAITHTGGKRTGKAPHRVLVLLDPNDTVSNVGRAGQVTRFAPMGQKVEPPKPETPPIQEKQAQVETASGMTDAEFDAWWEQGIRRDLASEVEQKVQELQKEADSLRNTVDAQPESPAIGQMRTRLAQLEQQIVDQEARLTAPIKKPSEFMSPNQIQWWKEQAVKETAAGSPAGKGEEPAVQSQTQLNQEGATSGRPSSMSEENPGYTGARPTLPTNAPPLEPVKRRAIVKYLENAFGPLRVGFKGKALGIFKRREGVIRTQGAEDFPVQTHEIGHRLDRDLNLADPAFDSELLPLGAPTSPQNSTQQYIRGEGVGEFIRLYITDPAKAQQVAPRFAAAFDQRMQSEPDIKAKLDGARELVKRWTSQNAHDKLNGIISVDEQGNKRPVSWERFKAQVIEQLAPLERAVSQLAQGQKLKVDENPYELALLSRGWAGRAESFLEYGVTDANFNKVGESYREILKDIPDKDAFRRYTIAKRAIEIMDKRKLPIEQVVGEGVSRADLEQVVNDLKAQYEPLSKRMIKFQDSILQELVDSGRISQKEADAMRKMNEEYIPFHRFFDEKTGAFNFAGANHLVNVGNPLKPFKGSDRSIVDPLESVIKNTYAIVNASARNRVGRALLDLAEKSKNMGAVVEIVDENARDSNIVNVYRNGEKVRIKVDPELQRSLLFLDREQTAMWVKIVGAPAKTLRAGAILNPDFLASNPLADQLTAFINSEFGYVPFVDLVKGIGESARKTDVFWKFMASGGAQSQMVSLDRNYLQKELNKYIGSRTILGSVAQRANPLEVLRALSEQGELGTRLGEFRKGVAQDNSREGIQKAALAARDVTIDFGKTGSKTKTVNQISAFFNASVQGLDKTVREFKAHPIRTTAKAVAAYTIPTVMLYLVNRNNPYYEEKPEWAKDSFWFIPLDWSGGLATAQQSQHFLWIPKKHALAAVFGALPERLIRMADKHDPQAFDSQFASRFAQSLLPSMPMPTAIMPILENISNYSFYTDLPLVPQREMRFEPRDRFGPYTSDVGKFVGGITNTSPRKTDNLIRGWTGGLGTLAADLAGSAARQLDRVVDVPYVDHNSTTASKGLSGYPVTRRFLRDLGEIGIGSSYDQFSTKLEKAEQKYASTPEGEAKKQLLKALSPMRKEQQKMQDLNTQRREVLADPNLTPQEKQEKINELDLQLTNAARKALGKPLIQ